jgi:undecaprenyl-diphosphatase
MTSLTVAPAREDHAYPHRRTLIVMAMICIALFVPLGFIVSAGFTTAIDQSLLQMFRNAEGDAIGPVWVREAVRDVTALGSGVVLSFAVLAATSLLWAAARHRLAWLLLGSAVLGTMVSTGLKMAIDRDRPHWDEPLVATFTASFPSGHALLTAAIVLTIGGLLAFAARSRGERMVIVTASAILTFSVGLSRIYLGVHWPSDVVGGWLIGMAWACLTLAMALRMDRPGNPSRG